MLRVVRSSAPRFFTTAPPRFSVRSIADSAAPFHKIQIQREDTKFDAYVVGKHDAPGIVVLQDWLGVDNEIKDHALRISQLGRGFKALIPDLHRGNAKQLFRGRDWTGTIEDVISSVNWLKNNGSEKVGVTGFRMGGALAIASSNMISDLNVDAIVAFYGVPCSLDGNGRFPVQAHFGELDEFVGFSDVTAVKRLEEKLKDSGAPHEIHIYPGKRHAFMNMRMHDEDDAAVQLAWSRFQSWMTTYLYS
ncbi:uncharacterized protein LOC130742952 isoform X1 [Lotus japonicus]|uniref:uncharacterized protein LOC130742952 isoform X1 n=1 Tax=Lotus japonicus TaxID=34305 RepID=UPI002586B552|nr:uncharacterized protein LOC130742952 isoform X1 [Lotus japonicus]XP_057451044.1 uncharacterized protein LOC130742952 isoform X1 [Lotus japonicus]